MVRTRFKLIYFDAPLVISKMAQANRRALRHAGGWIRKTARRSIRKAKSVSKPGRPPHSHVGLLRKFVLYGWDPATESVFIGPVGFPRSEVPALLEHGGRQATRWDRVFRNNDGLYPGGKKWVRIERAKPMDFKARPFMGPALDKALVAGVIPSFYRRSGGGF